MITYLKHISSILAVVILTHLPTVACSCTCIGKDQQTTENELNFVDIVVKGKVISVANFDYYDTVGNSFTGQKFDPKQSGYLVRKYQLYTLVVDKNIR